MAVTSNRTAHAIEQFNELAKDYVGTWNAAIEAAALVVQPDPHIDEERECQAIAAEIRKLKK